MVIDFLYQLGKDILEASKFTEQEKLVDRDFLDISGLKSEWENKGYTLRWTNPEKIETRKQIIPKGNKSHGTQQHSNQQADRLESRILPSETIFYLPRG